MPLDREPRAVTQPWTHRITFMQQTVLLTAVRGPDGLPKYSGIKFLLRWYRRCILVSSLDGGVILENPYTTNGGSFMGPSFPEGMLAGVSENEPRRACTWQDAMDDILAQYLRELDGIPHHFQMHLMHSFEIVGYKHPNIEIREWFHRAYVRLVHDLHCFPETEAQLDARLNDTREGWLARADTATVA